MAGSVTVDVDTSGGASCPMFVEFNDGSYIKSLGSSSSTSYRDDVEAITLDLCTITGVADHGHYLLLTTPSTLFNNSAGYGYVFLANSDVTKFYSHVTWAAPQPEPVIE